MVSRPHHFFISVQNWEKCRLTGSTSYFVSWNLKFFKVSTCKCSFWLCLVLVWVFGPCFWERHTWNQFLYFEPLLHHIMCWRRCRHSWLDQPISSCHWPSDSQCVFLCVCVSGMVWEWCIISRRSSRWRRFTSGELSLSTHRALCSCVTLAWSVNNTLLNKHICAVQIFTSHLLSLRLS